MQSVSTDENHDDDGDNSDDDNDDDDDDDGDYDDDGGDCVCDDESFRANYLREHRREWLQD